MIAKAASSLYGTVVTWRRQWYARDPSRQLRLARPVISVGNLSVGGSGKTPIVAHVARLLLENGERPAILSRGYGRRVRAHGATVVSDGEVVRADVESSGDEPLMLARSLPGVRVVVGADRYLSGCLADRQLGATVHVLDDGFQHVKIARDVDLLVISEEDLSDLPLPAGRLREPLTAAVHADAAIVPAGYSTAVERIARSAGIGTAFRMARAIGAPRTIAQRPESVVVPPQSRVFAIAGIARPERFFADVEAAGWDMVGTMEFRDHHWFNAADIRRISAAARAAAAAIVLTTEKDAVRLERCDLNGLPIASVPLEVTVEPAGSFRDWLLSRVFHGREDTKNTIER